MLEWQCPQARDELILVPVAISTDLQHQKYRSCCPSESVIFGLRTASSSKENKNHPLVREFNNNIDVGGD